MSEIVYLETRYLKPTETAGARFSVKPAGSKSRALVVGMNFEFDGGIAQHLNAVRVFMEAYQVELIEQAFGTANGWVFRVSYSNPAPADGWSWETAREEW